MAERPISVFSTPAFSTMDELLLRGTMAVYESQAELSAHIPSQWREFRLHHPHLAGNSKLYGASPCTSDRKIHYLTGVAQQDDEDSVRGERLVLEAGEYAVVIVEDATMLRQTWVWLLRNWLPTSGRREKSAPEFERYSALSDLGHPVGPVEIWIPLEPLRD